VEDDLVVQGPAADGMRMADNGGVGGVGRAGVQQSFEPAGRAVEEQGTDGGGGFWHAYRVQRRG
jgi:hypothetical protein